MSTHPTLATQARSARSIALALIEICHESCGDIQAVLDVQTSIDSLNVSRSGFTSTLPHDDHVKKWLDATKGIPDLLATRATIKAHGDTLTVKYECDDAVIGKIWISGNSQEAVLKALPRAKKLLSATTFTSLVDSLETTSASKILRQREQQLGALSEQIERLGTHLAEVAQAESAARAKLRSELEEQRKQDQSSAEDAIRKRRDQVEAELQKRQSEADERIRRERAEFEDERRRFLDDKAEFERDAPRLMRRKYLEKIDAHLKAMQQSEISESTTSKRRVIHVVCSVGILAGLGVLVTGILKLMAATAVDWHMLVPISGGTILLAATMVYYLKWNDRWFREHAEVEFASKRYRADMLRLSWAAELIQERAREGQNALPQELLDACTRNVFRDGAHGKATEHPLDAITSVLKRANELNIDGRKLQLRVRGQNEQPPGSPTA